MMTELAFLKAELRHKDDLTQMKQSCQDILNGFVARQAGLTYPPLFQAPVVCETAAHVC